MSSSLSSKRRSTASEKIAIGVLEELGYKVLETSKKISINGIEVGEIDAIAIDQSGEQYAVEVKAGRIDVSGIRQAYVNALLVGCKPLVVSKGFSDDAAKELAEKLNVKVIQLSDVFLVESEELYIVIREIIEETLTDYLEVFYGFNPNVKQEYLQILEAISRSPTISEAAEKLGLEVSGLAKKIDELKRLGIIPRWATKYNTVKQVSQLLIQRHAFHSAQEESKKIIEYAKTLEELFKQLQYNISQLNTQLQRLLYHLSEDKQ
ncbi:MAG: restriction endonuclease [Desulfurococcaceae archaeon]